MKPDFEQIVLRGNSESNNLVSAFGKTIMETRLTSFLGYLISLNIIQLNGYLDINYPISKIVLEKSLKTQRCDIVIETINNDVIIEAKVNNKNTTLQIEKQYKEYSSKYKKAIKLVSLTRNAKPFSNPNILSKSWQGVYQSLSTAVNLNSKQKVLSEEFMSHLSSTGLVDIRNKEVYARDVNKVPNLALFLKAQVYFCKFIENIYKCSYFAPYFGNKISVISPGIKEGMSYIGKIISHIEVNNYQELSDAIRKHIKDQKIKINKEYVDELLEETRNDDNYNDAIPHASRRDKRATHRFRGRSSGQFLVDRSSRRSCPYADDTISGGIYPEVHAAHPAERASEDPLLRLHGQSGSDAIPCSRARAYSGLRRSRPRGNCSAYTCRGTAGNKHRHLCLDNLPQMWLAHES